MVKKVLPPLKEQNDIANIIALEVENFAGNQSLQNIVKYLYKILSGNLCAFPNDINL